MTAQTLVLDLLQFVGIYGFEDNQTENPDPDDRDVEKAVTAVNAALQQIYDEGPSTIKFGVKSSFFNAPANINLTMVHGGGGTSATSIPAWMRGSSIMVEGDSVLNRILDIRESAPFTVSLLRGYTGAAGLHSAVVYGDTVLLDEDVAAVIEPVEIAPNRRLRPAQSKADFNASRYYEQYAPFASYEKQVGDPTTYLVEQRLDSAFPGGSLYLSLNPMPGAALNLTYGVYRRPETITREAALDEDGDEDPGYEFTSLSPDKIESILVPVARWKFFSHPTLKNNESRGTIKDEYDEAMRKVRTGQSFSTSVRKTRARYL